MNWTVSVAELETWDAADIVEHAVYFGVRHQEEEAQREFGDQWEGALRTIWAAEDEDAEKAAWQAEKDAKARREADAAEAADAAKAERGAR